MPSMAWITSTIFSTVKEFNTVLQAWDMTRLTPGSILECLSLGNVTRSDCVRIQAGKQTHTGYFEREILYRMV